MHEDDSTLNSPKDQLDSGVSRRDFLKISGISAAVPLVASSTIVLAAGKEVPVHGPGKVPMEFAISQSLRHFLAKPRRPRPSRRPPR